MNKRYQRHMSTEGIEDVYMDVYITEGNVTGDVFVTFVRQCLLPILQPFNRSNSHSVIVLDNASVHHYIDGFLFCIQPEMIALDIVVIYTNIIILNFSWNLQLLFFVLQLTMHQSHVVSTTLIIVPCTCFED